MNLSVIGDGILTDARDVHVKTEVERSQRSHNGGSKGGIGLFTSDLNNEGMYISTCFDYRNWEHIWTCTSGNVIF